jgi:hypothetical protein
MTVFDLLLRSIAISASHNGNDVASPSAIFWPDSERQCEPVFGRLSFVHPRLITLAHVAKKSA